MRDGYPVVPRPGERPVEADLPLVEFTGEDLGDGRLAEAGVGVGWSIGATLLGRYFDPETRTLYVERSFSVEILDAPYPLLKSIAEGLRQVFRQQEVILKSYDTGEAEHIREPPA